MCRLCTCTRQLCMQTTIFVRPQLQTTTIVQHTPPTFSASCLQLSGGCGQRTLYCNAHLTFTNSGNPGSGNAGRLGDAVADICEAVATLCVAVAGFLDRFLPSEGKRKGEKKFRMLLKCRDCTNFTTNLYMHIYTHVCVYTHTNIFV